MRLRLTTPDEIDVVLKVLSEGRAAIGRLGIDQWQQGYPDRDCIVDDVRRGVSYVVVDGEGSTETILATAVIDFDGEPVYDDIDGAWLTVSDSANPTYAVIHRIAVGDGHTRKGVARFLLGEACVLAKAKGAKSLRIDTHAGNVRMLNLLASSGLTECGIVHIDYAGEATPERTAFEILL